jgi:hypothetical protein
MPIVPVLPLLPASATGHHTVHPPASGAFAAVVQAAGAQTSKAVKPSAAAASPRQTRRATETDDSLDEETNTLDAKAHFRPGTHSLDVEA